MGGCPWGLALRGPQDSLPQKNTHLPRISKSREKALRKETVFPKRGLGPLVLFLLYSPEKAVPHRERGPLGLLDAQLGFHQFQKVQDIGVRLQGIEDAIGDGEVPVHRQGGQQGMDLLPAV